MERGHVGGGQGGLGLGVSERVGVGKGLGVGERVEARIPTSDCCGSASMALV